VGRPSPNFYHRVYNSCHCGRHTVVLDFRFSFPLRYGGAKCVAVRSENWWNSGFCPLVYFSGTLGEAVCRTPCCKVSKMSVDRRRKIRWWRKIKQLCSSEVIRVGSRGGTCPRAPRHLAMPMTVSVLFYSGSILALSSSVSHTYMYPSLSAAWLCTRLCPCVSLSVINCFKHDISKINWWIFAQFIADTLSSYYPGND